jgi:hypothetical protein
MFEQDYPRIIEFNFEARNPKCEMNSKYKVGMAETGRY